MYLIIKILVFTLLITFFLGGIVITLFFGIYPAPYLDVISSTMDNIINHVVSLATFASM